MQTPAGEPAVRAVAVLGDRLRWQLYAFVRGARRPVSREEAAKAAGISRKLAAFHLGKLAEAGLLQARPAQAGEARKAGRRPVVYEPAADDVHVSIPARQHGALASLLIDAVLTQTGNENARQAVLRVARGQGERAGASVWQQAQPGRLGAERALTLAGGTLGQWGFEPDRQTPARLLLRNCPFHPLAAKAPDLVCGVNHAFLAGFLAGLHATTAEAVLAPRAGECCVELRARAKRTRTP